MLFSVSVTGCNLDQRQAYVKNAVNSRKKMFPSFKYCINFLASSFVKFGAAKTSNRK